jgi:GNAT superfamily N-acetyltransferase
MVPEQPVQPASIRAVSPAELGQGSVAAGIEAVYADAFAGPPYNEPESAAPAFVSRLRSEVDREGWRLVVAGHSGLTLGFAYGYVTRPGQWWHDQVTPVLDPELVERWLADAFVLVEFAVLHAARSQGVGRRLQEGILRGLPQAKALTMTHQHENPALHFYLAHGWRVLADGFRFHEREHSRAILGRELHHKGSEG